MAADIITFEHFLTSGTLIVIDVRAANYYPFTHDFLSETATRIINNVKGINRVTYDITSMLHRTIEWELKF